MRILAWNIQSGGGERIVEIVKRIAAHRPDVVVLTEFGGARASKLCSLLQDLGFSFCETSQPPRWANGVLIAARSSFELNTVVGGEVSEPERRLVVRFDDVEVCGLYFPLNETKREFWRETIAHATTHVESKCLLIGDFNTTQHFVDEVGASVPGSEYFDKLRALGWIEAWRSLNADSRESTWYHRTSGNGFRIDHAWLSPPLVPYLRRAWYSHEERESRVSDHSVLLVEFDFSARGLPPDSQGIEVVVK